VLDLVTWLRHGLAPGNIATCKGSRGEIAQIVSVCGYPKTNLRSKKNPLWYVAVPTNGLKEFLLRWLKCLSQLRLSSAEVAMALDASEAA